MEYSLLGPTGVKVSKICLGTATFGVAPDAQEAGRVVHAALDLGIRRCQIFCVSSGYLLRGDTAVSMTESAERAERRARQKELADRLKASGALDGSSSKSMLSRCRWPVMTVCCTAC